jgi:hypothetical protein
MATKEDMKTEFSLFSEVWTFYKKYYGTKRDDDQHWEQAVKEADAITAKYDSVLARDLILAVLSDLEARAD